MVAPQFPGQTPGQQGLQRLQKQQQDMMRRQQERGMQAAWDASRRKVDESVSGRRSRHRDRSYEAHARPGFFRRLVRSLIAMALWLVTMGLVVATMASFVGGYNEEGIIFGAATLIVFSIFYRIQRRL